MWNVGRLQSLLVTATKGVAVSLEMTVFTEVNALPRDEEIA